MIQPDVEDVEVLVDAFSGELLFLQASVFMCGGHRVGGWVGGWVGGCFLGGGSKGGYTLVLVPVGNWHFGLRAWRLLVSPAFVPVNWCFV
jgi:hypothetical protein